MIVLTPFQISLIIFVTLSLLAGALMFMLDKTLLDLEKRLKAKQEFQQIYILEAYGKKEQV